MSWSFGLGLDLWFAQLSSSCQILLISDLEFLLEFTVKSITASREDMESFPYSGTFPMTKMFFREVINLFGLLQVRGECQIFIFPKSQVVGTISYCIKWALCFPVFFCMDIHIQWWLSGSKPQAFSSGTPSWAGCIVLHLSRLNIALGQGKKACCLTQA